MPDQPVPAPAFEPAPDPSAPSGVTPGLTPPASPSQPAPPKPDQGAPEPISATGRHAADRQVRAQSGAWLTTAQGARIADTDHSLKAGERGPTLLADHHLREKITHFDHERIPERVVHARGAAAHGTFRSFGTAAPYTSAAFLAAEVETPVFVRFSTVLGSRGSADTVRDTRGFATKFYTSQGVFDLVGNNIPVFFIQDAIKFPDIIHAGKPHPDLEIPQAQSAHDTFWDFVSLHTEAQNHTIWNMSDRAIPRSYRMMEGFGIHTFRLVNAQGATVLVKFHWKPRSGVHSLVWHEAQLIAGMDPDFHRRDLADAIAAGNFPSWELGLQVMPDTAEQAFAGVDLLDPTKLVPEEVAPVIPVGLLTLDRNPTNYFAETEQVAFHPGHLVPGIDVTSDPLLQGRLFSYLDTQISRLGGPNFAQLPINRTHAPVNDMLRDGMHQSAVHTGVAPYHPNSLDGGCPFPATFTQGAVIDYPEELPAGRRVREHPASFDDHFSQARLFYRSLTPVEQGHVAAAYTFELGKCFEAAIRTRQLACLAQIDSELCAWVAAGLGLPVPHPVIDLPEVDPSPALSQLQGRWPVVGRQVGILTAAGSDPAALRQVVVALDDAGMVGLVVAETGAALAADLPVARTYLTARSVEFDAVLVAGAGSGQAVGPFNPVAATLISEAYAHCKALGAWGSGDALLTAAGVTRSDPGVRVGEPATVVQELADLLAHHRVWERTTAISG